MTALLVSLLCFAAGATGSLIFAGRGRWSTFLGAGGVILGCVCGAFPAARVALGEPAQALRMAWDVPYGSLFLQLDALSAFFLLPIFLLCALAALYGTEYLEAYRGRKALAPAWFFLNLLVASMVIVVLARNGLLFLMAWETMALSSFFLVTFENEKEDTRQAGWIYLVASHIGTAFLLVMFVLLGKANGSLDFDRFTASSGAGLLFVLALVGFGTKAGFVPLHVWLPEAHPAAPSHVSAVMSAIMIKTGIYGLLRILTFLGPLHAWWGWVLCMVGLTSGILGGLLLQTRRVLSAPQGLFPQSAEFLTQTDDPYQAYIFQPLFHAIGRGLSSLRPVQQGKVQLYVLYIAITLLILLLCRSPE